MSLVVLIMGLVIALVYPIIITTRQTMQKAQTQANLSALLNATAAFVQSHGCVPCPTKASATGTGFGRVRGDELVNSCAGCAQSEGIVPFASLGIPASMAKDGWGRWITMSVDPALTINFGEGPPSRICPSGDTTCTAGESNKGLCRADLAGGTTQPNVELKDAYSQKAAVVFISHGENGQGAYRSDPYEPPTDGNLHPAFTNGTLDCAAGNSEHCNADNDKDYTVADYSLDSVNYFDDQLVYLGRDALVAYLGNRGCQTVWDTP